MLHLVAAVRLRSCCRAAAKVRTISAPPCTDARAPGLVPRHAVGLRAGWVTTRSRAREGPTARPPRSDASLLHHAVAGRPSSRRPYLTGAWRALRPASAAGRCAIEEPQILRPARAMSACSSCRIARRNRPSPVRSTNGFGAGGDRGTSAMYAKCSRASCRRARPRVRHRRRPRPLGPQACAISGERVARPGSWCHAKPVPDDPLAPATVAGLTVGHSSSALWWGSGAVRALADRWRAASSQISFDCCFVRCVLCGRLAGRAR